MERNKSSEIPKYKTADHFLLITWLHIVQLRQNLQFGGIIARMQRLGDENVQFRKSNTTNGSHFENHYISICQPQIVRIAQNLFADIILPHARETTKKSEIRKFKMVDGRCIGNHFLAITQPHAVPLR